MRLLLIVLLTLSPLNTRLIYAESIAVQPVKQTRLDRLEHEVARLGEAVASLYRANAVLKQQVAALEQQLQ